MGGLLKAKKNSKFFLELFFIFLIIFFPRATPGPSASSFYSIKDSTETSFNVNKRQSPKKICIFLKMHFWDAYR